MSGRDGRPQDPEQNWFGDDEPRRSWQEEPTTRFRPDSTRDSRDSGDSDQDSNPDSALDPDAEEHAAGGSGGSGGSGGRRWSRRLGRSGRSERPFTPFEPFDQHDEDPNRQPEDPTVMLEAPTPRPAGADSGGDTGDTGDSWLPWGDEPTSEIRPDEPAPQPADHSEEPTQQIDRRRLGGRTRRMRPVQPEQAVEPEHPVQPEQPEQPEQPVQSQQSQQAVGSEQPIGSEPPEAPAPPARPEVRLRRRKQPKPPKQPKQPAPEPQPAEAADPRPERAGDEPTRVGESPAWDQPAVWDQPDLASPATASGDTGAGDAGDRGTGTAGGAGGASEPLVRNLPPPPSSPSTSREDIMSRIRAAVGGRPVPEYDVPRGYRRSLGLDHAEAIALFAERVRDYRAQVHRISRDQVPAEIAVRLVERGIRSIVVPFDAPPSWLPQYVETHVDNGHLTARDLDQVDGVITGSAVGIAETGTIVLDGGRLQGRRILSLVPDYHLCLVDVADIVDNLPEAMRRLDGTRPLTFISGPSATSDIELDRVEGVHGPRMLDVLLVG